jgi:hypothetical protein
MFEAMVRHMTAEADAIRAHNAAAEAAMRRARR